MPFTRAREPLGDVVCLGVVVFIQKIFVCFGPILNCQLLPSQENPQQHRGYGFIEFSSADAAKLAIETMNGFPVVGKQLKVNYATALRTTPGGMPIGLDFPAGMEGGAGGVGGNSTPGGQTASAGGSVSAANETSAQHPSLDSDAAEQRVENAKNEGGSSVGGAAASQTTPSAETTGASGASSGETQTAAAAFPKTPSGEPGSSAVLLLTNTVSPEEVDDDLMEEVGCRMGVGCFLRELCSESGRGGTEFVGGEGEWICCCGVLADARGVRPFRRRGRREGSRAGKRRAYLRGLS